MPFCALFVYRWRQGLVCCWGPGRVSERPRRRSRGEHLAGFTVEHAKVPALELAALDWIDVAE